MGATIGNNLKITIFGESHGDSIGIVIDNLPAGLELDFDKINAEMLRRAPGRDDTSTPRKEPDIPNIVSGIFNGRTTGAPLCAFIQNTNKHSSDYSEIKSKMRPSHADYTAYVKYRGFNDYRGGGHFSGRITAPLVFAGAVAKQILNIQGISIFSHIKSIKDITDKPFDCINPDIKELEKLKMKPFPVLDEDVREKMHKIIINARENQDSVGGVIECMIYGVKAGIGSPFFYSVESVLSHLLFSVPAVKGVEFGEGFDIASRTARDVNDEMYVSESGVKTYTNHNGGVLGGITNGMPVVFRTAIKPTPSVAAVQKTIDIDKMENCTLAVRGRHDPCIVLRALPVIEAAAAIGICDLIDLQNL